MGRHDEDESYRPFEYKSVRGMIKQIIDEVKMKRRFKKGITKEEKI